MSGFDGIASAVLEVAGGIFDATVTATACRRQTLSNLAGDVVRNLELAANASLGATSITVRLPSSGAGLAGQAPAGLSFTLGGQSYVLAADAVAVDQALTFSLTTGLLSSQTAGAAIVVGTAATFSLPGCLRQDLGRRLAELAPSASFALLVPKGKAPAGFEPRLGDVMVVPGEDATVMAEPFDGAGVWELACGGA